MADKIIFTWNDIYEQVEELAKIVKASNKNYSSLFGIPRGGINVAQILTRELNLPLTTEPTINTLIVDDVVDSGKTLSKYKDYDSAVLHFKSHASIKPTYFVKELNAWIVYPWEIQEESKDEGIQDNVRRILEYIGEDPNREGLLDTPSRVERAYGELFCGYKKEPKDVLNRKFEANGYDEMVILKGIEFYSFCEHHMLPFFGTVDIGYIPIKKVVGISKLARLVEIYARRLQIQEKLTEQIATAIMEYLNPLGVGVKIEAKHFCMISRGVNKQNSVMTTSKLLGAMFDVDKARAEFFKLIEK